jgi:hypothetical protein
VKLSNLIYESQAPTRKKISLHFKLKKKRRKQVLIKVNICLTRNWKKVLPSQMILRLDQLSYDNKGKIARTLHYGEGKRSPNTSKCVRLFLERPGNI